MKDNNHKIIKTAQGDTHTYVFEQDEKPRNGLRSQLVQIGCSICASLVCLPFGIMLGWPSPTYIILLAEDSPLPISMVQSPLIAGLLMFGAIFGTFFSNNKFFSSKHGILVALILMTIGWTIMWQATNLFYLLGSRFVIGTGMGYGLGQAKIYVKNISDGPLIKTLSRMISSYIMLGVLIAYIMGLFTDFRSFSLISLFITIAIFFICFFLPLTPRELVHRNKIKEAKKLLRIIKPGCNLDIVIGDYLSKTAELNLIGFFKLNHLRHHTAVLVLTAFVQQFCGAPALVVYCQFMFREMQVPNPEHCAIFYGFVFLVMNLLGTYYTSKYNKKYVLLISCMCVTILLISVVLVLYFKINEEYEYLLLILMTLYLICHTLGLATVPFKLSEYLFPKNARLAASLVYFMFYCLFAVIITKLFQVFYSLFAFYILFCLFTSVGVFGCVFICLFIPSKSPIVG